MAGDKSALPIKSIVHKLISDLSEKTAQEGRINEEDITRLWKRAAGKIAGSRSKPTSLRKGKLTVAVENSSVLYDLTLRKRQILDVLAGDLSGKIHDIQFRIGEISGSKKTEDRKQKTENRRDKDRSG